MTEHINKLLINAKNGDKDSSETLIKYYTPLLQSVVNKFIRTYKINNIYDDLLQDATLLFLEFIRNYNPELSNFGYFLKKNFEFSFYNRFSKFYFENNNTVQLKYNIEEQSDIFNRINIMNDIASTIEKLPLKQQIAIKLYYFTDLVQSDCALYMDMKQSAFSRLLDRSRKNMKKLILM